MLVLTPLLLAVVCLAVYRCHTVPLSQCSEVYRRYHDLPGIQASFIKDKQINDTLRVDMTLFEAEDSTSFASLLRAMGESDEFINDMAMLRRQYITREDANGIRFSGSCLRGHPEEKAYSDRAKSEVISIFPVRLCIVVFHTQSEPELETVLHKSYFDEIHID